MLRDHRIPAEEAEWWLATTWQPLTLTPARRLESEEHRHVVDWTVSVLDGHRSVWDPIDDDPTGGDGDGDDNFATGDDDETDGGGESGGGATGGAGSTTSGKIGGGAPISDLGRRDADAQATADRLLASKPESHEEATLRMWRVHASCEARLAVAPEADYVIELATELGPAVAADLLYRWSVGVQLPGTVSFPPGWHGAPRPR